MNVLRSSSCIITFAVMLAGLAYWLWSVQSGRAKLTATEIAKASQVTREDDRLDVKIILPFAPEQFHFVRLQNYGRMVGADENSVSLRNVDTAAARQLARQYWISDIQPLEAQ